MRKSNCNYFNIRCVLFFFPFCFKRKPRELCYLDIDIYYKLTFKNRIQLHNILLKLRQILNRVAIPLLLNLNLEYKSIWIQPSASVDIFCGFLNFFFNSNSYWNMKTLHEAMNDSYLSTGITSEIHFWPVFNLKNTFSELNLDISMEC